MKTLNLYLLFGNPPDFLQQNSCSIKAHKSWFFCGYPQIFCKKLCSMKALSCYLFCGKPRFSAITPLKCESTQFLPFMLKAPYFLQKNPWSFTFKCEKNSVLTFYVGIPRLSAKVPLTFTLKYESTQSLPFLLDPPPISCSIIAHAILLTLGLGWPSAGQRSAKD